MRSPAEAALTDAGETRRPAPTEKAMVAAATAAEKARLPVSRTCCISKINVTLFTPRAGGDVKKDKSGPAASTLLGFVRDANAIPSESTTLAHDDF